uniref:Uncharacterized protein n=1 Tax=Panagrolaimus sp. ES5 TaxID=591445 RepID=A0AC34F0D2_9BILA
MDNNDRDRVLAEFRVQAEQWLEKYNIIQARLEARIATFPLADIEIKQESDGASITATDAGDKGVSSGAQEEGDAAGGTFSVKKHDE